MLGLSKTCIPFCNRKVLQFLNIFVNISFCEVGIEFLIPIYIFKGRKEIHLKFAFLLALLFLIQSRIHLCRYKPGACFSNLSTDRRHVFNEEFKMKSLLIYSSENEQKSEKMQNKSDSQMYYAIKI